MNRTRSILTSVALLSFALFFVFYFYALPRLIESKKIQAQILSQVEAWTGGEAHLENFSVRYFPWPHVELGGLKVKAARRGIEQVYSIPKLRASLSVFDILLRNIRLSKLEVFDAEIALIFPNGQVLNSFKAGHVHFKFRRIKSGKPVSFEGDFTLPLKSDLKAMLRVQGDVTSPSLLDWDWDNLAFQMKVSLRDLGLGNLDWNIKTNEAFSVRQGVFGADFQLNKTAGEKSFNLSGKSSLKDWAYRVAATPVSFESAALSADAEVSLSWDPVTEKLQIHQSQLLTGMGALNFQGTVDLAAKEFKDARFVGQKIILEDAPKYFYSFQDALPVNSGFSGEVSFETSLDGIFDHLSIHGSMDLQHALVNYTSFFSKPKGLPCGLLFDFLVRDNKTLSGDVSMHTEKVILKGAVTGLNLETGEGQINLITNKFPLARWVDLSPPLQTYKIDGAGKFLINVTGDIFNNQNLETMFNLTIENGSFETKEGHVVKGINLAFDSGEVAAKLKNTSMVIDDIPIFLEATFFGEMPRPNAEIRIESPKMNLSSLTLALGALPLDKLPEHVYELSGLFIEAFKSLNVELDGFSAALKYADEKWKLEDSRFKLYDGDFQLTGEFRNESSSLGGDIRIVIDHLSLAQWAKKTETGQTIAEGDLFVDAQVNSGQLEQLLKGHWFEEGKSFGRLIITNGAFHTFDILETLSAIEGLTALEKYLDGSTRFDDMRLDFTGALGKWNVDQVLLKSDDLWVAGDGEILGGGILNLRLQTYLDETVSRKVLKRELWDFKRFEGENKLGPIVLLLSGELKAPELKPDALQLDRFLEDFRERRTQRVFRHFLPEELFFGDKIPSDKTETD